VVQSAHHCLKQGTDPSKHEQKGREIKWSWEVEAVIAIAREGKGKAVLVCNK
jgi:hypothetical protein